MSEIGKLEAKIREKRRSETEALLQLEREELDIFTANWRELLTGAATTIKNDMETIEQASKIELKKSLERQSQLILEMESNYTRASKIAEERAKKVYWIITPIVIIFISLSIAAATFSWLLKPSPVEWEVPASVLDQNKKWISIEYAQKKGIKIEILEEKGE